MKSIVSEMRLKRFLCNERGSLGRGNAEVLWMIAFLSVIVSAFWWAPMLWKRSWIDACMFATSALFLAAAILILFFRVYGAYYKEDRNDIAEVMYLLWGPIIGAGTVALHVVMIIKLKGGGVYTLSDAILLNHGPLYFALLLMYLVKLMATEKKQ